MKFLKYYLIFITLFAACISHLGAMETKDVAVAKEDDKSTLSFNAINERLAKIDFSGCHFTLEEETPYYNFEHNYIRKTINIWLIQTKAPRSLIGFITYRIPITPKNADGLRTIVIDMINIIPERTQNMRLGRLLALTAFQDAIKISGFSYAYVKCICQESIALYKNFNFEKSEKISKNEQHFSTEKLPDLMNANGPALLEEAFTKLEATAKTSAGK